MTDTPARPDPITRFLAAQPKLLALALFIVALGCAVPAAKYGTRAFAPSTPTSVDEQKPDAPKAETPSDPKRSDYVVFTLAGVCGAVLSALLGVWVLTAPPPLTEAAGFTRARIAALASGGLLGGLAMLVGLGLLVLWFESVTAWLDGGDTKAARWVLLPLFIFLIGAGLVFVGVQPSRAEERSNPMLRKLVYGTNLGLTGLLLFFALLVGNVFLALRLPNKLDTTESGFYSLADETKTYLSGLEQPVTIYTTMSEDSGLREDQDGRRLLTAMQEVNPAKVRIKPLSPVLNKDDLAQLRAKYPQYDLTESWLLIIAGDDDKRTSFVRLEDLITFESGGQERQKVFQGESRVMREILFLGENKTRPVLYVTQGSGELDILPAPPGPDGVAARPRAATKLKTQLDKSNIDVRAWKPDGVDPKIPDDAAAVLVADPRATLPAETVAALKNFVRPANAAGKKGKLIVLTGPFPNLDKKGVAETGLEGMLADFNIRLGKAYLVGQPVSILGYTDFIAEPNPDLVAASHPLAGSFAGGLLLSDVRNIGVAKSEETAFKTDWLLAAHRNGSLSWSDPDPPTNPAATLEAMRSSEELMAKYRLTRGRMSVAAVVSEGATPRMVVVGSGASFADAAARRGLEPPVDVITSAVDWLRDRPTLAVVSKPYTGYRPAKAADGVRLFWLPLGLMLLSVSVVGAGVWVVRRK